MIEKIPKEFFVTHEKKFKFQWLIWNTTMFINLYTIYDYFWVTVVDWIVVTVFPTQKVKNIYYLPVV